MSSFGDTIYVIVPTVEITIDMINHMRVYFNTKSTTLRKNSDKSLTLFKVKQPVPHFFDSYTWYNQEEILVEMAKSDWSDITYQVGFLQSLKSFFFS